MCGGLDTLEPEDGEDANVLEERRAYAESRKWVFHMSYLRRAGIKKEIVEKDASEYYEKGLMVIMYALAEGEEFRIAFMDAGVAEERIRKFRETGVLTLDRPERLATEGVEPVQVIVLKPEKVLNALPKFVSEEVKTSEVSDLMI